MSHLWRKKSKRGLVVRVARVRICKVAVFAPHHNPGAIDAYVSELKCSPGFWQYRLEVWGGTSSLRSAKWLEKPDATTASNRCAQILQAIVAETTEYSKKSVDDRLTFVEKLLGAKSLDTVIQIQSDYAKTSYEGFVVQTKKMGELYSDLAKAAFKPFDAAINNVQATKQ
jgi:hypothetical protein